MILGTSTLIMQEKIVLARHLFIDALGESYADDDASPYFRKEVKAVVDSIERLIKLGASEINRLSSQDMLTPGPTAERRRSVKLARKPSSKTT